jgi:L-2-hydroxyglutarate oxidase LhgO
MDPLIADRPASKMSNRQARNKKVIIAGGGIAGLTLGVLILSHAKEFYDVVILERVRFSSSHL